MRVNAYENNQLARQVRCWLDGEEISHDCYEADDEKGYAICYIRDEKGRVTYFNGVLNEIRREGEIRFSLITPWDRPE